MLGPYFLGHFPRLRQVRTYLHLAREGKSVVAITHELGLHNRSYVHHQIQRQALELSTCVRDVNGVKVMPARSRRSRHIAGS